jgi:meso-butanediol dehydrogenase / (S,S)-butanediol dehydrogenase / diacetyl reductase
VNQRYAGKVAVVTGGVSGIGGAVTRRLLLEGATVIAVDVDEARIERFAAEYPTEPRLVVQRLDVQDRAAVDDAIAGVVRDHGRLDVLVANAGVGGVGAVADVTDESWRRVLGIDLDGVFFISRAALPHLIETRGSIVTTASVSGMGADLAMAAYNTAKGAVINLTRSIATDYAKFGVRANAVAPGAVQTPLLKPALDRHESVLAQYKVRIPLERLAQPEEIAAAVLFLASDDASYITGVILPVDGGLTAYTGQPRLART